MEKDSKKLNFKEFTPNLALRGKEMDELYKKAFLSEEDNCDSEYSQNTSTWD